MKRLICVIIALFVFSLPSYADEKNEPALILTSYSLSEKEISPGKNAVLTVKIKNVSSSSDALYVKISFSGGEILCSGKDSVFTGKIAAGKEYKWETGICVNSVTPGGKYQASIKTEYKNKEGEVFSSSDGITLTVNNPPSEEKITAPRLYAENYSIENGFISPESSGKLTVKIKNANKYAAAHNIKICIRDESGDIRTEDSGKVFIPSVMPEEVYNLEEKLHCIYNASVGEHKLSLSIDYEDGNGTAISESETLYIDVRQSEKLETGDILLPSKIIAGENTSVTVNFINSGKSDLYNCKAVYSVEGLTAGGAAFAGKIPAGELKSASAVLKAEKDTLGELKGTVTVFYENAWGETTEKTFDVSTLSEAPATSEKEEKKASYLPCVLFAAAGTVMGAGGAAFITWAIFDRKQRKADDLRL